MRGARDGGVYDKHPDGSAVYHAPNGTVRYYHQHCYSDEDRSDGRYYSSESPEETDSEHDYRREGGGPGPSREYHVSDDRGVVVPPPVPDSESPSEEGVPESESETETEDCSDRYVPEEYESGSACDRDDYSYDSYGDSFDDDDYDGTVFVFIFPQFPVMLHVLILPSFQTKTLLIRIWQSTDLVTCCGFINLPRVSIGDERE